MSKTWRRISPTTSSSLRVRPVSGQRFKRWVSVSSGSSTRFKVWPLRPFCPPGFFPLLRRKLRFFASGPKALSVLGGFELLLLFFLSRSSICSTQAVNCSVLAVSCSTVSIKSRTKSTTLSGSVRHRSNKASRNLWRSIGFTPDSKRSRQQSTSSNSNFRLFALNDLSSYPVRAAIRYIENRIDQLDYKSAIENDLPIGSPKLHLRRTTACC